MPHSAPMLLLDRAVEADETTLKAQVTIRQDSLFCQNNEVGAWVGLEYMAQAVGAHAGFLAMRLGKPVRIGFLLGTRHYHCSVHSFPVGTTLEISVRRQYEMIEEGLGSYQCILFSEGKEIANALCTVYQPQKS